MSDGHFGDQTAFIASQPKVQAQLKVLMAVYTHAWIEAPQILIDLATHRQKATNQQWDWIRAISREGKPFHVQVAVGKLYPYPRA